MRKKKKNYPLIFRFKNGGYFLVETFFGRHYVNRCDKNGNKIKSNIIPFKKTN